MNTTELVEVVRKEQAVSKAVITVWVMILALFCFPFSIKAHAAEIEPEVQFNQQVNALRENAGLQAYTLNTALSIDASIRAEESARLFSHVRPDGTAYYELDSALLYGENLAKTTISDSYLTDIVTAWINSPSHYANLMDTEFKTVGYGFYVSGNKVYVAMEFGY